MKDKPEILQAIHIELERVMSETVWILKAKDGFVGVNYLGNIIAMNKYKSTLEFILRQRKTLAIAIVVEPNKRQPNRKLRRAPR